MLPPTATGPPLTNWDANLPLSHNVEASNSVQETRKNSVEKKGEVHGTPSPRTHVSKHEEKAYARKGSRPA